MNILRESMTRIQISNRFTIRVWRQEPHLETMTENGDMIRLIRELADEAFAPVKLAEKILKMDRVNAVEVIDSAGNGDVLYRTESVKIGGRTFDII